MNKAFYHKILLIVCLFFVLSFKTIAQGVEIKDSTDIGEMLSGIMNRLDVYNTKWLTIGTQYDFINTTFGLQMSNGYDERPLIHFEDFSEDFVFKLKGNTDFGKDYSFGATLGYKYPIKRISLVSFGFDQYDYSQKELFHRDFSVSVETFSTKLDLSFILKIAYQTLNDMDNIGAAITTRKVILYRKLYSDLSIGYYFDYFTYSANLQSYIYDDDISLRLEYDRIDNYDFLKLGVNISLNR